MEPEHIKINIDDGETLLTNKSNNRAWNNDMLRRLQKQSSGELILDQSAKNRSATSESAEI